VSRGRIEKGLGCRTPAGGEVPNDFLVSAKSSKDTSMAEKKEQHELDAAGVRQRLGPAEVPRKPKSDSHDVRDLLEWKLKRKRRRNAPPPLHGWREKLRQFSWREKQAVLLGFLLSDGTRDEQLKKAIEALLDDSKAGS
jgi:hypothetical protein